MSQIKNYRDLVMERHRVEGKIAQQKQNFTVELLQLKEQFMPFVYLLPVLSLFKKKNDNQFLPKPANAIVKFGSILGIDYLVTQKLLAKAGWFTKLTVPMFLKSILSGALRWGKKR
jgi:hypothetical protein